jgi:hypothetical protein
MNQHPDTLYLYVTAKTDDAAIGVYSRFGNSFGDLSITRTDYYALITKNYELLKAALLINNLRLYFVNGGKHMYLNQDEFTTTNTLSAVGCLTYPTLGIPLYRWLQIFDPTNSQPLLCAPSQGCLYPWSVFSISSQCAGDDCSSSLFSNPLTVPSSSK